MAGDGLTVERFGVVFGRGLRPFQGMTLRRIFGLLMGLAVAVASAQALPPETHRLRPDHLPTPFSAAQIRAANPPGRVVTFVITTPGEPEVRNVTAWLDGDEAVARFRTSDLSAAGVLLGPPTEGEAAWEELQAHASFPAAATTVEEASVEVPAGRYACWLYTVTSGGDEAKTVTRFWFARDLPGPPVRLERRVGETVVMTMVLAARE